MIKGIGVDIIELERIARSLNRSERLAGRVLTEKEMLRFQELTSFRRKVEYLGGRFAAKEACAKALGTGIGRLGFKDIEVVNGESGAPTIQVAGFTKERFFLSISHSEKYAVAQVVVEE